METAACWPFRRAPVARGGAPCCSCCRSSSPSPSTPAGASTRSRRSSRPTASRACSRATSPTSSTRCARGAHRGHRAGAAPGGRGTRTSRPCAPTSPASRRTCPTSSAIRVADADGRMVYQPEFADGAGAGRRGAALFRPPSRRALLGRGHFRSPTATGPTAPGSSTSPAAYEHPDGRFAGAVVAPVPVERLVRMLGGRGRGPRRRGERARRRASRIIARHPPVPAPRRAGRSPDGPARARGPGRDLRDVPRHLALGRRGAALLLPQGRGLPAARHRGPVDRRVHRALAPRHGRGGRCSRACSSA